MVRGLVTVMLLMAGTATAAEPLAAVAPPPELAALQVRTPDIAFRQLEVQWSGIQGARFNGDIGYGVTPAWKLDIIGEAHALAMEHTVNLAPGLALFAGYAHDFRADAPDTVFAGPIIERHLGPTQHTLDLLLGQETGAHGGATGFAAAWQSLWLIGPLASPGVEGFSITHDLRHARLDADYSSIGPVLAGAIGPLHYEIGYQFGLTAGAPRGAVVWRLAYVAAF